MYCQSCGAENTEGARFCNMCGTSLAKAGETGGLLTNADITPEMAPEMAEQMAAQMAESTVPDSAASGPQNAPGRTMVGGAGQGGAGQSSAGQSSAGQSGAQNRTGYDADLSASGASMMGVSLAGIGVKSSKKTWSMILLGALALLGAGALASWLAIGGSSTTDGHAEPDDPFLIGSPLPSDGDVDSITGMAGVATRAGGMEATMRSASVGSGSPSMTTASMTTASMTTASMTTASMTTASMTTASMTTASMTTASMTTSTNTQMTAMTSTPSEMTSTTSMTSTMSSTSMNGNIEVPEERDIEMELYSTRVRFLIRRYYASRAAACFDRATRNNPSVSGTVVIGMTIEADGNVSNTRVVRNTTGNEALGNCLSAQVSSWRLSAPPRGSQGMEIPFSR